MNEKHEVHIKSKVIQADNDPKILCINLIAAVIVANYEIINNIL